MLDRRGTIWYFFMDTCNVVEDEDREAERGEAKEAKEERPAEVRRRGEAQEE